MHAESHGGIRLGTSSFTAAGWESSFYPAGMKPAEYLTYYATKFDTVEVDSTFYRAPSASTVEGWARKTPDNFIFAVKVPQAITHEKILADCDDEFTQFVKHDGNPRRKTRPHAVPVPLFQSQRLHQRRAIHRPAEAVPRKASQGHKFAVEIRNKNWLDAAFAQLLRDHGVALALQDQSWMPLPSAYKFDPITADWTYIRWLGDRKEIENVTKTWDKVVVDRTSQLISWVDFCHQIVKRGVTIFAYANNHYAGHAPATIKLFKKLWDVPGQPSST